MFASHAPDPRNSSERLVFANLYESLVAVDCKGALVPGLAESWTASEEGRVWLFSCRSDVFFADGTRCRAQEIEACWSARRKSAAASSPPWARFDALDATVKALNDTILIVTLARAREDLPNLLALPAFAVTKRAKGEAWPLGTGPFRAAAKSAATADALILTANPHRAVATKSSRIVCVIRPGWDERDLIASDVDALLVRDRAALEYAESRGEFAQVALEPDRLYVLLTPPTPPAPPADTTAISFEERVDTRRALGGWDRAELARDVVSADARGANSLCFGDATDEPVVIRRSEAARAYDADSAAAARPAPLDATASAESPLLAALNVPVENRIVYPSDDDEARRLAERMAALASDSVAVPPIVSGLSNDEFERVVASGAAVACILPIDRRYARACFEMGALIGMAKWLEDAALANGRPAADTSPETPTARGVENRLIKSGAAIPLVATRPNLLAKQGIVGFRRSGEGTLLLEGAGWAAARAVP
ncbi:MAG: ABC transporter substrate-binding protein [bacterium]